MAATFHLLVWSFSLLHSIPLISSYKISTLDAAGVCNDTIYLEEGAKSAAILRLTAKDFYDTTPLRCVITFKAPQHSWSGLTGVLEEVDLRRFEDTADHHMAQNQCVDYIKVLHDSAVPQDEQCGSWSVQGSDKLNYLGFRRSLFGYCQNPPAPGSTIRCGVSEMKVEVSIGQRDFYGLRKGKPWRPHRGFTFVVTAYRYSFGESGCIEGLQSCGKTDYHGYQHHCVHKSLWCDHHINCGQPKNTDENLCRDDKMISGLVTVMVGPWIGAALLVVMLLSAILYWRRSRPPPPPQGPPPPQDHNSYAESYEVSSTMSSAHHMAIQVRVVCNSGHGTNTPRLSPWQAADLPPSYDSLFPQGPPPPKSNTTATTTITTTSAASFNISTTSLVSASIGSNASATPGPSGFYSNTTQTSSIVIPISAICKTIGSPVMSSASFSTTTFANTSTSVNPTITNTTTSTTTIASVRASPTALASISVTSVSLAAPSDSLVAFHNKDNDTVSPSHESRSSNSSRAPTPNSSSKLNIKENPSSTTEIEPEDTNLTPCISAGSTQASADVQLPCTSEDTKQHNAGTLEKDYDPAATQFCDKLSLSPRSKNAKQDLENEPHADEETVSRPSTMSASCTGSYDLETSDRPDSESEETEEITLDDEDASKSALTRNSDDELNVEFSTAASNSDDQPAYGTESTRPLLSEVDADHVMHENSLDKDDESLL